MGDVEALTQVGYESDTIDDLNKEMQNMKALVAADAGALTQVGSVKDKVDEFMNRKSSTIEATLNADDTKWCNPYDPAFKPC